MHGPFISVLLELTTLAYGVEVWLRGMVRKMNRERTRLVRNNTGKSLLLGLSAQSSCDIPGCHSSCNFPAPCLGRNPRCLIFFSLCAIWMSCGKLISLQLARLKHVLFLTSFIHITALVPQLSFDCLFQSFGLDPQILVFPKPPLFFYAENRSSTAHLLTCTSALILLKTITANDS